MVEGDGTHSLGFMHRSFWENFLMVEGDKTHLLGLKYRSSRGNFLMVELVQFLKVKTNNFRNLDIITI